MNTNGTTESRYDGMNERIPINFVFFMYLGPNGQKYHGALKVDVLLTVEFYLSIREQSGKRFAVKATL